MKTHYPFWIIVKVICGCISACISKTKYRLYILGYSQDENYHVYNGFAFVSNWFLRLQKVPSPLFDGTAKSQICARALLCGPGSHLYISLNVWSVWKDLRQAFLLGGNGLASKLWWLPQNLITSFCTVVVRLNLERLPTDLHMHHIDWLSLPPIFAYSGHSRQMFR